MYYAGQSEIIRTTQRDLDFRNLMNFKFLEIFELFIKHNVISRYEKEIKLLTDTMYFALTTGSSLKTLGEEYTNIVPKLK